MDNHVSLLVTFSMGTYLIRVGLKTDRTLLTGDVLDAPLEPENKEKLKKLLPLHIQTCGEIVEVSELFDIAIISP